MILPAAAVETKLYHYGRDFEPIEFGDMGTPTTFKVIMAASELTGIVGPTNIVVDSEETYAKEYEGVSWGYPTAIAAWTNALDCHMQHYLTHPGVWYDNAGWVKGTKEAYDEWGAYVWYLQNRLTFKSSPTNEYVSGAGVTSEIARVLVGSLGDYCPQATVTEYSPALDTNYPGADSGTNAIFRADTRAYYKLAIPMYSDVNDGDADGDGIPDYADGFNWDGVSENDDDQTLGDAFVPWLLTLPSYVNVTQTMIRFDYSASSPTGLVRSGSVSNYTYTPASGTLRLWKKRAYTARLKTEVSSGGDYIASTNYSASALGVSVTDKTVTIYVEGITPWLDQAISVYFSTNGASWTCLDGGEALIYKVEITNIKFNHDTGSSVSDAINIRQDYNTVFDISNGEWIEGETNIPVCYTTNRAVTIKAQLTVQPDSITSADIWAVSTDSGGSLGDVIKTNVTFVSGVASDVVFRISGTTPNCIRKTTNDVWQWKMENVNGTGSAACDLNTSGVHTVYTILGEPVAPWDNAWIGGNNSSNAWVTALHFTIMKASCNGDSTASNALMHITQYLHTGHGLTYDTTYGYGAYASSYTGGTFQLTKYLDKSGGGSLPQPYGPRAGNIVNCYDQASGVTVLGRLIGIGIEYRFMNPFGYINAVDLVGEGNCNNPFYPWISAPNNVPLIGTGGLTDLVDPDRSLFSNHAFAKYGGNIYDACAGPHTGTKSEAQYVAETVDTSAPLEANPPLEAFIGKNAGDTANITSGNIADIQ